MYGKQVYKGDIARSVLGEGKSSDRVFSLSDARLYNKNELSQLFELEPDGVCKTIERMSLSGVKNDPTKKGVLTKVQAYIVGLTCRADIHNANKRKAISEEDAENGKDDEIPPPKSGYMEEFSAQTSTVADSSFSKAEASGAEPNYNRGNEEETFVFSI
jgi:hypothetical protein